MDKARQAHIRAEIVDNQISADYHGMPDDLVTMIERMAADMVDNRPTLRRKIRRAVLRATRRDWVEYLLDGWPFTLAGAAVLFGLVYAFSAFCHWMGVI